MKNTSKKGFTLVELVIVIAVIAILAGVLIGTFASVLKRAKDSADIQNIKNAEIAQKADDIIKKIEDSNWFGWEDFEVTIVTEITNAFKESNGAALNEAQVEKAVEAALTTYFANNEVLKLDLTKEDVEAIINNALGSLKYEGVTEAQVRAIVNAANTQNIGSQLTAAQVRMIVNAANENNLTATQLAQAVYQVKDSITSASDSVVVEIKNHLNGTLQGLSADIEDLQATVNQLVFNTTDNDNVIVAKTLNIIAKRKGVTSVSTPTEWFELTGEVADATKLLYKTETGSTNLILSLTDGRFSVIDLDNKVLYSETLTGTVSSVSYWVFVNVYDDSLTYSQYLLGIDEIASPLTIDTGLDVGYRTVSTINYDRSSISDLSQAQTVIIRTNGGTLKIDAQNDSVHHYGEVAFLDIEAINTSSYHEFGYAPYAQIKTGRIVNEAGTIEMSDGSIVQSGVENVFIVAESEGSGETAGTFNEVIIEAAQGSFVPSLDRSDVNIVGAVLVVEVKTANSDDYVYLTKAGIIEQVIVTSEKNNTDTTTASATFGTDESLSDASSKAANEIANIVKRGANGRPLKDDETEMSEEEVAAISSVDEITISEPKATFEDLAKSQGENALFAGGTGTKGNPYLITSEDWWFKFAQLCKEDSDYSETNGKYFKVTSDINVGKYESGTLNILYFAGNIDFNYHKLFGWNDAIITDGIGAFVGGFDHLLNATIQNLDFYTYLVKNEVQLSITSEPSGVCVLKNCNVYGNCDPANWNNTGFFVVYPRCSSLTLENCNNYANLINSGYSSAFIGRILAADDCDIYFKNCNNYANIISTNAGASMLIANPALPANNNKGRTYNIHIENCNNYGVICGTEDYMNLVIPTNNLYPNPNYTLLKVNGTNINTGSPSQAERYNRIVQSIDKSMNGTDVSKVTMNTLSTTNGYFDCAEIENATKYVLSFGFTPSNRNGARYGYNMTFDTVPQNVKVGSWIAKSELDVNTTIDIHMGEGTEYYTSGDYYVYHDDQGTILDTVKVAYIAYDKDGNIIYLASYTYQD